MRSWCKLCTPPHIQITVSSLVVYQFPMSLQPMYKHKFFIIPLRPVHKNHAEPESVSERQVSHLIVTVTKVKQSLTRIGITLACYGPYQGYIISLMHMHAALDQPSFNMS